MKIYRCKLSEEIQDKLKECFLSKMSTRNAAKLAGVNRNTAFYFYQRLKKLIEQGEDLENNENNQ